MTYTPVAQILVGSRAYNLHTQESDYDYTVLYRRDIKDYITLNEYKDYMPEKNVKEVFDNKYNFKYWDLKKFFFMCRKSSYGALELLLSESVGTTVLWNEIRKTIKLDFFELKPLLYHCRGIIGNDHHRGYIKALNYIFCEYMLQNNKPISTLDYMVLINNIDLNKQTLAYILDQFEKKLAGDKFSQCNLDIPKERIDSVKNNAVEFDYNQYFKKIIMEDE